MSAASICRAVQRQSGALRTAAAGIRAAGRRRYARSVIMREDGTAVLIGSSSPPGYIP